MFLTGTVRSAKINTQTGIKHTFLKGEQQMKTVQDYMKLLAEKSSTDQHELVTELLDYYGAFGVRNITLEQAAEFCRLFEIE